MGRFGSAAAKGEERRGGLRGSKLVYRPGNPLVVMIVSFTIFATIIALLDVSFGGSILPWNTKLEATSQSRIMSRVPTMSGGRRGDLARVVEPEEDDRSVLGRRAGTGWARTAAGHVSGSLKGVIVITATYARPYQAGYLTLLANVLRLTPPPLLWIVVESGNRTMATSAVLHKVATSAVFDFPPIDFVHIASEEDKLSESAMSRPMAQRNAALKYIRDRRMKGIIYFADDDNLYTPHLFQGIREVKEVGILPVGVLRRRSESYIEHPLVRGGLPLQTNEAGTEGAAAGGGGGEATRTIVGWHTMRWDPSKRKRKLRRWHYKGSARFDFPVFLSGFAFNSEFLWRDPDPVTHRPIQPVKFAEVGPGRSWETEFLNLLVRNASYLEPLGEREMGEVWVWRRHQEAVRGQWYPPLWTGDQMPIATELSPEAPIDQNYRITTEEIRLSIDKFNADFNNLTAPTLVA